MWTSSDPCVNQNAGCPVASFVEIAQKLQDSSDREVATAAARALAGVVVAAHGAADLEARRGWTRARGHFFKTLRRSGSPRDAFSFHSVMRRSETQKQDCNKSRPVVLQLGQIGQIIQQVLRTNWTGKRLLDAYCRCGKGTCQAAVCVTIGRLRQLFPGGIMVEMLTWSWCDEFYVFPVFNF